MSEITPIFLVLLLAIVIYFAWMDVALYYKLQSHPENLLLTQNYRDLLNQSTTAQTPLKMEAFDPFNPLSLKLLCLDHANHYVYYPLGSFLDLDVLKISEKLTFITPDMISFSHVMVGALAGKFLSSEMLNQRRIGVLFFEVRSFLDSLDGLVARSRSRQRAMIADHTQWGYWIDGLADLIGTIFFMIGILFICQRSNPRKLITFHIRSIFGCWKPRLEQSAMDPDQEAFLPPSSKAANKGRNNFVWTFKQSTVIVTSLSLLLFVSSNFWNRYMEQYHYLLEVPITTHNGNAEGFQLETMRSASFWIIVWSWRLLNPHALMSVLLVSIFFDKAVELFVWIQYLGFLPLLGLIVTSEVHLQATSWKLWYLSH